LKLTCQYFRLRLIAGLALFVLLTSCQSQPKSNVPTAVSAGGTTAMMVYNADATNSADAMDQPYVILISIDGYRWDYNKVFSPPNLVQVASEGVQADSLRPVYPSKTFPNHYTLITGMYADHHGIVSNEFYDPARDAVYSLPDRKAVEDGSWYFGEPLWITAGKQGMLSASFFWVGSEADILGGHPNYFYRYDDSVAYDTRTDQVLTWLKLTPDRRPHFITMYFEGVDSNAHRYGTGSKEMKDAVMAVDAQIGRLREGIKSLGLPVNIVIVSDHGMADLDPKKVIILDDTAERARLLAKFRSLGRGPQMLLYLNKGEDPALINQTVSALSKGAKHYRVWKRDQMVRFNYSSTPRIGDIIIEPDLPYVVGLRAHPPSAVGANHGWDPAKNKIMHGVFYAVGPTFAEKSKLPTVDNVNVYPLIVEALGLKQRVPIDGKLDPVRAALREHKPETHRAITK
jgi:predicted AlkP superfamily pyrophosphatase or phosphodiesterase